MLNQYAKFLKTAREVPWRAPVPALGSPATWSQIGSTTAAVRTFDDTTGTVGTNYWYAVKPITARPAIA